MTTTQRGILPWVFENVRVNVCAPAGGEAFDTAVVSNVMATIKYSYTPVDEDGPAEAAIHSLKLFQPLHLRGDVSSVILETGFDLLRVLPEIEVESLQELIVSRHQNMARIMGKAE